MKKKFNPYLYWLGEKIKKLKNKIKWIIKGILFQTKEDLKYIKENITDWS